VSALGASLPAAAPDEGAFAAFERVLTALVTASAQGPVVVVLDDLHWADDASLELVLHAQQLRRLALEQPTSGYAGP